jgi:hypothetical protein
MNGVKNTPWLGPDLDKMAKSFEQAFVQPVETMTTIVVLTAALRDAQAPACDWVSSNGRDGETYLTEVCGGSGYFGRPRTQGSGGRGPGDGRRGGSDVA